MRSIGIQYPVDSLFTFMGGRSLRCSALLIHIGVTRYNQNWESSVPRCHSRLSDTRLLLSADKASSEVRKGFKDWFDRSAARALADQIAQAKPGVTASVVYPDDRLRPLRIAVPVNEQGQQRR